MVVRAYSIIVALLFSISLVSTEALVAECKMNGTNGVGKVTGLIRFLQSENTVDIIYTLYGIEPQNTLHGFHIHQNGEIGNECMDAGGHFNPFGKLHGDISSHERHLGDLGNVQATLGNAIGIVEDDKISLEGEHTVIGRTIVIHEGVDDLGTGGHATSTATGNAGSRLQCCIIT